MSDCLKPMLATTQLEYVRRVVNRSDQTRLRRACVSNRALSLALKDNVWVAWTHTCDAITKQALLSCGVTTKVLLRQTFKVFIKHIVNERDCTLTSTLVICHYHIISCYINCDFQWSAPYRRPWPYSHSNCSDQAFVMSCTVQRTWDYFFFSFFKDLLKINNQANWTPYQVMSTSRM